MHVKGTIGYCISYERSLNINIPVFYSRLLPIKKMDLVKCNKLVLSINLYNKNNNRIEVHDLVTKKQI